MAAPRHRAEIMSHAAAPDAWEAGIHAESEVGPIEVGLAVEPAAVGLVVEAPGVGRVQLALEVGPDGATRLSAVSRQGLDGEAQAVLGEDAGRALLLEGELARAQGAHAATTARLAEVQATLEEAWSRGAALDDALAAATLRAGELEVALAASDAQAAAQAAELELATQRLAEYEGALAERDARLAQLETEADRAGEGAGGGGAIEAQLAAEREALQAERARAERLLAERDEARGIARQLHQRLAAKDPAPGRGA